MAGLDVRKLRRQSRQVLDSFTIGQRATMVVAVVAVIVGIFVFTQASSDTTKAPLFSGLTADDASAIAAKLDAENVSYDLADNGATILVPKTDVYRLRIDMSAQGLPTGGAEGYSLLDNAGITTSQFKQRVDYQRALAGELSRTIEAIDGVSAAKVNLVIPASDVWAGDTEKSTASVLVSTQGNRTLTSNQVQSIVNLVANGVPDLSPDSITIADSTGRPLWSPSVDGGGGSAFAGADQADRTFAFEDRLGSRLQTMLEAITGAGKVKVQVKADLDFDQRVTQSKLNQAPNQQGEDPLVVSEKKESETFVGPGSSTGGIAGVDGTPIVTATSIDPVTGSTIATGGTTGQQYVNSKNETSYAINEVQTEVRSAPGAIKRLGIGILVDDKAVTADQLTQIETVVRAAADVQDGRDTISLQRIGFDTTQTAAAAEQLKAEAQAASGSSTTNMIQTGAVVLIVLLTLFLAWRSLKKAGRRAGEVTAIDVRELEAVREAIANVTGSSSSNELSSGDIGALGELPAAEQFDDELEPIPVTAAARAATQLEAEIGHMVDREPDEVAAVLRNWLSERKVARR